MAVIEYNALLEKFNTLKTEVNELEKHIDYGKKFHEEDMYEMPQAMNEDILERKQQELLQITIMLKEAERERYN